MSVSSADASTTSPGFSFTCQMYLPAPKARGGQAVVHQFSNVGTATAHPGEPRGCQGPQLARLHLEPGCNRRIAFDSSRIARVRAQLEPPNRRNVCVSP
jgi:hypothetical protein